VSSETVPIPLECAVVLKQLQYRYSVQ